jgi:thioredoxin reductase (NADPH)
LAAAVYASSEGIQTLVIDSVGPGGQAGSSSKIENFIGFPTGLSGSELANRGYLQALKFGTQFIAPITVQSVHQHASGEHHLKLCTGQTARARVVTIASGVSYRQLDLPGCTRLEGSGVYYAATSVEGRVCEGATAVVVGGGNSAGQAAMFLATKAKKVVMLIRGPDLSKGMSSYLSARVNSHPKIQVVPNTELTSIEGESRVQSVKTVNYATGEKSTIECRGLFIFIGATPHTKWLPEQVLLDDKGFVLTGSTFMSDAKLRSHWTLDRTPCDLETTVPGILAAGDVRAGTTKRCGFAVGDGSLAVSCVHRLLSLL